MEKYWRRFLIVISAAIIWGLVLLWLIFKPNLLHAIAQSPYWFLFLVVGGIVPVCFFPFIAKRQPGHAISLTLLAGGIVFSSVCGIAQLVLDIDNDWIDRILGFSQVLIFLSCLIFIWKAVRKSSAEKRKPAD
jgi:hypothetical protein